MSSPSLSQDDIVSTRISSHRGTRARAYATRLGSVHIPGDAQRTHVRMSRYLPFYDPKVEGRQVTRIGSGGLKSADRLQGGAGPASWAECAEVWAALLGWAEPEGVGPRKGVLGREHWRAGPNLRAKRVARSGLYLRRGGTSRIFSAGLSRASWAESARLDLQKPKRWAEPVRRRTSEKTKIGGEEGSDGRERRFPPLGAATTVQEGAGDDGERCLGYVVLERGVARLGSVGIERSFDFFLARFSSFPARDFPSSIVGNRGN
ncbi:hypothetical protein CRG98_008440 [Punica granatum]|uniref:Uncharacterized protein n=1 Tax=Punica granatum TaxID=22663 RepID=A0A2I0KRM9_PUNGR|nr:hypothetical protein CRG98_008440 [Punica granatum]